MENMKNGLKNRLEKRMSEKLKEIKEEIMNGLKLGITEVEKKENVPPELSDIQTQTVKTMKKKKRKNSNSLKTKNQNKKNTSIFQNKLLAKSINYYNSSIEKNSIPIKTFIKMFFSVSILNFIPLHLRNISNKVYMHGKCYDLKNPESFQLFLILSKSKILFTYRNNFSVKIVDTSKNTNLEDIQNKTKELTLNKYTNKNKSENIMSVYHSAKKKNKITNKINSKSKKTNKIIYIEEVINFSKVSETFLENIYVDEDDCLCILLDDVTDEDLEDICFGVDMTKKNGSNKNKKQTNSSNDLIEEHSKTEKTKSFENIILTDCDAKSSNNNIKKNKEKNNASLSNEEKITEKVDKVRSDSKNFSESIMKGRKKKQMEEVNKKKGNNKKEFIRELRNEKNKYKTVMLNMINREKHSISNNKDKYIYMSDYAWGCIIRVVQMVVANILTRFKISKKYNLFHNLKDFSFYKNHLKTKKSENEQSKQKSKIEKKIEAKTQKDNEFSLKTISIKKEETRKIENMSEFMLKSINEKNTCFQSSEIFSLPENKIKEKINVDKGFEKEKKNEQCTHDKKQKCVNSFENYERFLNNCEETTENLKENNFLIYPILRKFRDIEESKYSIQNIIYETLKNKKIEGKHVENFIHEWLGPTSSAVIMSNLINKKTVRFVKKKRKKRKYTSTNKNMFYNYNELMHSKEEENKNIDAEYHLFDRKKKKPLFFSVAFDTGIIYNDKVLKYFNMKINEVHIIIWICLKLGTDSLNISKYKNSILSCFYLKQFQAVSSGNIHTSAHYFFSANMDGLFYIDPHIKCQEAFTSINENRLYEFFTNKIKFLPWEYLNSSMALVFVVRSKDDYFNLTQNLKMINPNTFEIFAEEPKYSYNNEVNVDTEDSGLIVL